MYEGAIQDLIDELGRLPGIGPKSAQRIAFHVLSADPADVKRLSVALQRVLATSTMCDLTSSRLNSGPVRYNRNRSSHTRSLGIDIK